jgi:capsid protein
MNARPPKIPVLYGADGRPIKTKAGARNEQQRLQQVIRKLHASYDASKETDYTSAYWANADYKSPNAANSPNVLRKLRARSRYEIVENNPYLKGAVLTLCNDFVGTGPTLNITDTRLTIEERSQIQRDWLKWFRVTKLRRKLWQNRIDRLISGAGYALMIDNPRQKNPVHLSIKPFECDHVASPFRPYTSEEGLTEYNGIKVDQLTDEPVEYYIHYEHPGTNVFSVAKPTDGEWVPASRVLHWIRRERNWHEGIPELTPSLPLCALLRRYTLATVLAAETAASITAILKTMQMPNTGTVNFWSGFNSVDGEVNEEELEIFPIERGMMMQIPKGNDVVQMDPKQPTAVYDAFVNALLREILRPILVPFNIGSGYSGGFNMASGALDIQMYRSGIETDRTDCDDEVIRPLTEEWWNEYKLVQATPAIRTKLNDEVPDHTYGWDSVRDEHTDPNKVAQSIATKLKSGIISDEDVQQSLFNRTADEHYVNLQKQQEARAKLGMPIDGSTSTNDEETPDEEPDEG